MKITVFTGNQPRHVSLIRRLAGMADTVYAVQECTTLFPGAVQDSIYNQSPLMKEYFSHVLAAEEAVFGATQFSPTNVKGLSLKMGDLSGIAIDAFEEALQADHIIVFGSSYIKPPLVDALIARRAVNLHMGVSPYFRGSGCNFWALYDGHPELVGATIHLLSRGLDSGDMLFHALPAPAAYDPFVLGMKAVEAAHKALCDHIYNKSLATLEPVKQNRNQEIRYSRYADFNDRVVSDYLKRLPTAEDIGKGLTITPRQHPLLRPCFV